MKTPKILIVEDEESLREIALEQLKFKKYNVKAAKDGNEALELAKSFKPDIMILDLILPDKNGIEVLRELKSDPKTKDIKVVVVSNLSDAQYVSDAKALGAEDYFVKAKHSVFEILEKISQKSV